MDEYLKNVLNNYVQTINLENTLLDKKYRYTLIPNDILDKIVLNCKKKFNSGFKEVNDTINKLINSSLGTYLNDVSEIIKKLDKKEYFEQKSLKWHKVRQTMLTATDAEKIISESKSGFFEILRKKTDKIKSQPRANVAPLIHGTTYEDVSVKIYESRNNVKVKEYTVMASDTHGHIGASPDGIITEVDYSDYNSYSRYGRMLEIKNPYSRRINGKIKPEYYSQMQQQMFVTRLPVCDFLETEIKDIRCLDSTTCYDEQYNNLHEMIDDKLDTSVPGWESKVENKNIPVENLNKFGLEKGIIIVFEKEVVIKDDDDETSEGIVETLQRVELFPLNIPYTHDKITEWIKTTKEKYNSSGYQTVNILNWKLYKYSVITVQYHQDNFEKINVPKLNEGWKKIQNYIKTHSLEEIKQLIESNKKTTRKTNNKYNYEIDMNSILI